MPIFLYSWHAMLRSALLLAICLGKLVSTPSYEALVWRANRLRMHIKLHGPRVLVAI